MGYNAILYVTSGDKVADSEALNRLFQTVVDARENIYLLHIGEHHVTGFGVLMAHHHIANDMQIRQEIYPHLKSLCDEQAIPTERIFIEFGDRALAIEQFVHAHEIEMLAVSPGLITRRPRELSMLTRILAPSRCDLHVAL